MADELPLTEEARRKATWKPGRPVLLTNGEQWHVPRPLIVLTVDETESGFVECLTTEDPQGRYLELARARRDAANNYEFMRAEILLGSYLLRWNYDLTPAEVARLMPFYYKLERDDDAEPEDPEVEAQETQLARIREEVMSVVRGLGPKPPPGGTGSSPTPQG
jgi:hypothetical protein